MNEPQYLYDVDYELFSEKPGAGSVTYHRSVTLLAVDVCRAIDGAEQEAKVFAASAQVPYCGIKVISAGAYSHKEADDDREHPTIIGVGFQRIP